jgi:hypothetical protein
MPNPTSDGLQRSPTCSQSPLRPVAHCFAERAILRVLLPGLWTVPRLQHPQPNCWFVGSVTTTLATARRAGVDQWPARRLNKHTVNNHVCRRPTYNGGQNAPSTIVQCTRAKVVLHQVEKDVIAGMDLVDQAILHQWQVRVIWSHQRWR